ncbi:MAG: ABC transporter permease [Gemmiger sp.]
MMLLQCIKAENRKLHASPIWVMFFLLPILSAVYGTFNYLQNTGILTENWYSLWTQHTLFYSLFFFPAMVGVYAAYLWRLEHLGHNWNLILSAPVPPFDLFLAKFVVVAKMVLLTQLFAFGLYWFCGKAFAHFPGMPPMHLFVFLLRGAGGGLSVVAMQLLLAMVIRNFAVPVFLALFGGVSGMLMVSKGFGLWWPYALMQMGMNSNRSEDLLAGVYPAFFGSCAVWLGLVFLAVYALLRHRDVRA